MRLTASDATVGVRLEAIDPVCVPAQHCRVHNRLVCHCCIMLFPRAVCARTWRFAFAKYACVVRAHGWGMHFLRARARAALRSQRGGCASQATDRVLARAWGRGAATFVALPPAGAAVDPAAAAAVRRVPCRACCVRPRCASL